MYQDQPEEQLQEENYHSIDNDTKPKILLMGPPRSGKSSILMVIFEKRDQLETVYLQPTTDIVEYTMYGGIEVYDLPGISYEHDYQFIDLNLFLGENTVIVFVIDTQDDIQKSLHYLYSSMDLIFSIQPNTQFNIFLHKIDGLSEELRQDINQEIQHRIFSHMDYEGYDNSLVQFYLTSIYNKSIYEAMSRVSHKLVPNVSTLENILTSFCYKSNLDKAYLFDMDSKLFIATDSFPFASQYHQFCCSTIGLMEDLTTMYSEYQLNQSGEVFSHQVATIHLDANYSIFTFQVNKRLMLICMVRDNISKNLSLLEFNAKKVSLSLKKVLNFPDSSTKD
ncbi:hypothetical protein BB561_006087 [Smittium simulii]|uniref:GTP-binding protein n=1 Tax=Smittium simulii TaxID=133385 RepID=A0A2T9Y6N4_9FUNG|nr:hypothetical protein BB561_006087 [Smittium simulii]